MKKLMCVALTLAVLAVLFPPSAYGAAPFKARVITDAELGRNPEGPRTTSRQEFVDFWQTAEGRANRQTRYAKMGRPDFVEKFYAALPNAESRPVQYGQIAYFLGEGRGSKANIVAELFRFERSAKHTGPLYEEAWVVTLEPGVEEWFRKVCSNGYFPAFQNFNLPAQEIRENIVNVSASATASSDVQLTVNQRGMCDGVAGKFLCFGLPLALLGGAAILNSGDGDDQSTPPAPQPLTCPTGTVAISPANPNVGQQVTITLPDAGSGITYSATIGSQTFSGRSFTITPTVAGAVNGSYTISRGAQSANCGTFSFTVTQPQQPCPVPDQATGNAQLLQGGTLTIGTADSSGKFPVTASVPANPFGAAGARREWRIFRANGDLIYSTDTPTSQGSIQLPGTITLAANERIRLEVSDFASSICAFKLNIVIEATAPSTPTQPTACPVISQSQGNQLQKAGMGGSYGPDDANGRRPLTIRATNVPFGASNTSRREWRVWRVSSNDLIYSTATDGTVTSVTLPANITPGIVRLEVSDFPNDPGPCAAINKLNATVDIAPPATGSNLTSTGDTSAGAPGVDPGQETLQPVDRPARTVRAERPRIMDLDRIRHTDAADTDEAEDMPQIAAQAITTAPSLPRASRRTVSASYGMGMVQGIGVHLGLSSDISQYLVPTKTFEHGTLMLEPGVDVLSDSSLSPSLRFGASTMLGSTGNLHAFGTLKANANRNVDGHVAVNYTHRIDRAIRDISLAAGARISNDGQNVGAFRVDPSLIVGIGVSPTVSIQLDVLSDTKTLMIGKRF